jgi:hypothetical protein
VFGRYDYLSIDNVAGGAAEDNFHEIAVGVNYYIHKHNLKVTLDGSWLPNGSPTSLDAIGVLANDGNNQFVFRAQLQLFL